MTEQAQTELLPPKQQIYVSDKEKLKFFLTVDGNEHMLSFERGQFIAREDADEGNVYAAMNAEYERKGSALRTLCKKMDIEKAREVGQRFLTTRMQAAQGPMNSQHLQQAATTLLKEEQNSALQSQGIQPAPGQPALPPIGEGGKSEADPKFRAAEEAIGTETVPQPAPAVTEKLPTIAIQQAPGFKFHQKNTNDLVVENPLQQ